MKTKLYLRLAIVVYSFTISGARPPFAPHFLHRQPPPRIYSPSPQHHTPQKGNYTRLLPSQETLHRGINGAAFLYATITIYWYYHHLNAPSSAQQTFLHRVWQYITPQCIRTFNRYQRFCLYALGTLIETAIYKTVAHGIISCTYGSVGDLFEYLGTTLRKTII